MDRLSILSRAAIEEPIFAWRRRKALKKTVQAVDQLVDGWKESLKEIIEVETLENFKALLEMPAFVESKTIRLKGEFQITTPLEVKTNFTVFDLSEAYLVYSGCPIFEMGGIGNAFIQINVVDAPEFSDTFEMLGEADGCLIRSLPESGNMILGLTLLNREEMNNA
jgi:hypothetical protein